MTDDAAHTALERALVASQLGRVPREPWRIAVRCRWGYPSVIVSPSVLCDGTPFPTLAWLTCPWLSENVSALESAGAVSRWTALVADDPDMACDLIAADVGVRTARAAESGGHDRCAAVGIVGQRDPLIVKCLHTHVALALLGIKDPVGQGVIEEIGADYCPYKRCARLLRSAEGETD